MSKKTPGDKLQGFIEKFYKPEISLQDEEKSLFDKLGGIFSIAAVIDRFSEEILKNPVVGKDSPNPQLRDWSRNQVKERLPGLKWMRTLWVASITGGPFKFTATRPGKNQFDLTEAHKDLKVSSKEFDAVAGVLNDTLDFFKVPKDVSDQVLKAFAAHKNEVVSTPQNNDKKTT